MRPAKRSEFTSSPILEKPIKCILAPILAALLPGAAIGQVDGYYEPPIRAIDRNSVDISRHSYSYTINHVSVGPDDDAPLEFLTTMSTPPTPDTYSPDAYIICDCSTQDNTVSEVPWTNPTSGADGYEQDAGIDLVYNGHTYQHFFNQEEGVSWKVIPIAGDPLGGAIQFTIADGTILNFPLSDLHCGIMCIKVNYIEFPNGMSWFYEYGPSAHPYPNGASFAGPLRDVYTSRGFGFVIDPTLGIGSFNKNCSTSTVFCNFKHEPRTISSTTYTNGDVDTTILDPTGVTTTIKQSPNATNGLYLINKILRSDLSVPLIDNTYYIDNQYYAYPFVRAYLISQKDANGYITQYPYLNLGKVIHPDSSVDQYAFSVTNEIYTDISSHTDPITRTTQVDRDIVMRPLKQTNPDGDTILYTRDTRGNLLERRHKAKPNSGATDLVESWGFPACSATNFRICNKPTYYVDANGKRTDYQYDAAHGGVTVVLLPADQDNKRGVIRYTYSAFYPAANTTAPPGVTLRSVHKIASETTCRSSTVTGMTIDFSFSCPSADATTANYEYQPSTQASPSSFLLIGKSVVAGGVTLRTCYQYDTLGNKISETSPRAGRTSCS